MSVLLVSLNHAAAEAIGSILVEGGFEVAMAAAGNGACAWPDASPWEVVGVVESEPEESLRVCRELRLKGFLGALLVLGVHSRDVGPLLDAGIDDFVLAPCSPSEVKARVRMAQQRTVGHARRRWGPVELDPVHRTAALRGLPLPLTATEYALLACLLESGGHVVSRPGLLSRIWGRHDDGGSNLVQAHMSRLRDKLGDAAPMIETVRGAGYRLRRE